MAKDVNFKRNVALLSVFLQGLNFGCFFPFFCRRSRLVKFVSHFKSSLLQLSSANNVNRRNSVPGFIRAKIKIANYNKRDNDCSRILSNSFNKSVIKIFVFLLVKKIAEYHARFKKVNSEQFCFNFLVCRLTSFLNFSQPASRIPHSTPAA